MIKEKKTAIVGGTLIDGTGKKHSEDAAVVIEGSRIVCVGRKNTVAISKDCEIVDASGLTIMPGLMDCHVHFTGCKNLDPIYWITNVEAKPLMAMRAVTEAWKVIDAGFTTVGDMGSLNGIYLKKAIDEGSIIGPRIIASGRALCRTSGHCDLRRDIYDLPDDYVNDSLSFCELYDGVDGVRRGVRKMQGRGADCIKFYATGGHLWEKDRVEDQHYTLEEMKAIVDEAHMYGLKVHAHCQGLSGTRAAVEAGIDVIQHGSALDEDLCKEIVRKNVYIVPTISINYVGSWAVEDPVDVRRSFKLAHSKGIKIASGSDLYNETTTPYGEYNIGEIKKLVEWGMSPMESIVSATKTASEALGIDDKVGTLENGKIADIIIVEGNPLDDIAVLLNKKNIKKIYKEGKQIRRF